MHFDIVHYEYLLKLNLNLLKLLNLCSQASQYVYDFSKLILIFDIRQ